MNKSFWSHFKHLWRLLGKIYLFLTPSKTDGNVPSQQGAPTTWLNGTFTRRIMSRHYWQVWGFLMDRTQHSSYYKNHIHSDNFHYLFPSNTFLPYYFFRIAPANIKFACRTDILRNRFRPLGAPVWRAWWCFSLRVFQVQRSRTVDSSRFLNGWYIDMVGSPT